MRNDDGRLVYALPGAADLDRLSELASALRRTATDVVSTGSLAIVKTPPGYAQGLALALDAAALGDVAGTIAGDDTIFVAAREGVTGAELAEQLRLHLEGESLRDQDGRARLLRWARHELCDRLAALRTTGSTTWSRCSSTSARTPTSSPRPRGYAAGAAEVVVVDRKSAFADEQVAKALVANALYEAATRSSPPCRGR